MPKIFCSLIGKIVITKTLDLVHHLDLYPLVVNVYNNFQVGQLLGFINETYFDSKMDFNNPDYLKSVMRGTPYRPQTSKLPLKYGRKSLVVSD